MFGWMFGWKRIAELEAQLAALQRQHDALAKQHDALNVRHNGLNQEIGELRAWIKSKEEAQRLAGRKKVRRRDPQTGRFESVYEDELESA